MKISQREARALRRRNKELEQIVRQLRHSWSQEFLGGTVLGSLNVDKGGIWWAVSTARRLGHAVVVTQRDDGWLVFHGMPVPKV